MISKQQDYNSIHCPELGDADKQFSELYKEFNELIELHGQGLFDYSRLTEKA